MISLFSRNKKALQDTHLSCPEKSFRSVLMCNILDKILDVAKFDMPIILIGEIGTGKKRIAQIAHENSDRASNPFSSFYCLDLTNDEYENAFREQLHLSEDHFILKYNIIEKASHGTIYLDQFSELPPDLMLDVIKAYKKGSEQLFRYNKRARPRLMLAVNMESYVNLLTQPNWQTVLNMLDPYIIMIPPLRERREDIPILVSSLLGEIKLKSKNLDTLTISSNALKTCSAYDWPGNMIQLHNALLQGSILSQGKMIESHHLPFSMNWKLPYEYEGKKSFKN